jgi:hypothetical protein
MFDLAMMTDDGFRRIKRLGKISTTRRISDRPNDYIVPFCFSGQSESESNTLQPYLETFELALRILDFSRDVVVEVPGGIGKEILFPSGLN